MASSVKEILAEANATVPRLSPAEIRAKLGEANVLILDVRDQGAINVSRGMLEFPADPESPYYNPAKSARIDR